ncbi:hypothetical protein Agub_g9506, partial [Astrephomene gubernaculifera]
MVSSHAGSNGGARTLPQWCLVTHDLKRFARQCAAAGVRVPAPPHYRQYFDTLAATYVFNSELFKPPGSSIIKPDSVHRMSEFLSCPPYAVVHDAMQEKLYGGGGDGASDPRVAAVAETVHNVMCYLRLQQEMREARQEAERQAREMRMKMEEEKGNANEQQQQQQQLVLDPCDLILEVEIPVQVVLAEMEMAGFGVDLPAMQQLHDDAKKEMSKLVSEVGHLVNKPSVNIATPEAKKWLLFDLLRLDEAAQAAGEELEVTEKG